MLTNKALALFKSYIRQLVYPTTELQQFMTTDQRTYVEHISFPQYSMHVRFVKNGFNGAELIKGELSYGDNFVLNLSKTTYPSGLVFLQMEVVKNKWGINGAGKQLEITEHTRPDFLTKDIDQFFYDLSMRSSRKSADAVIARIKQGAV